jgi:Ca-activated chloride channel family protein
LEPEEENYEPDIIVLLTDGANTAGPRPVDAAQQAADRGIRVYTIGFGTLEPGRTVCTRQQLGGEVFGRSFGGSGFTGGGGFGGSRGSGGYPRYLLLDEPQLEEVADVTGGAYFRAEDADQLLQIFLDLPTQISLQKENVEISVLFSALGAIFAGAAVAVSLRQNRFP